MTTVAQITVNQKNTRLVVLFVLLLLSSVGMFGQEAAPIAASINTENTVTADDNVSTTTATATESNLNINTVSWFMGSKQLHNDYNQSATSSNMTPTKKQIHTSGITPNRVLYRTFIKKVSSRNNAIV